MGSLLNVDYFTQLLPPETNVEMYVVVVHAMFEISLGSQSIWYPFLRSWPLEPASLQYFSDRELFELQDPSLIKLAHRKEGEMFDEFCLIMVYYGLH